MLESLDLPFVQRGLAEILLLSVGAGLIGTWIVLRGLAFHSHAVGTAAFPGLVLADGLGFAAPLGALGAAAVFAVIVAAISGRRGADRGSAVAFVLVGMLALGVILASDVFASSSGLETLLFGSLLLIDAGDLALAGAVSGIALVAAVTAGRHWLAHGFDAEGEPAAVTRGWLEPALLLLIALGTAAALTAVGALLVAALFVLPAATTRLWTARMRSWQLATIALCAAEGTTGVLVSVELNAPPGATIAVLAAAIFTLAAIAAAIARRGASRAGPLARWAGAGAAATLLAGCGAASGEGDLTVVATTPVAGDLTAQVAGEEAEVVTLLAANSDPHEYEPRPDDVEALANAQLVVAGGGDVDEWIADAMEDAGSGAELRDLSGVIPHPLHGGHQHEAAEDGDEADEELDPHWWHDPRNAAAAVAAIAEDLGDLAPESATAIERRSDDYARDIRLADRAIAACMSAVPAGERKLVTDHDSFAYLAKRYGIDVVGTVIPALTTEAQPSAGELAELRETIEREGVSAVFPEAAASPELAEAVARETGATADYELYGDSLGAEDSSAGSYLGMLRANADSLVRGFTGGARGCDA